MKTVMIVAAHKPYWMAADALYLPVQVGAAGKAPLGWQRDDEGESISEKNGSFCELTGHYWLWKNVQADYYGLCHYRRYFAPHALLRGKKQRVLTGAQAERLLRRCDVLLPRKRHYWIETNRSQYVHAHHAEGLALTERLLGQMYPDYAAAWDEVMRRRSGHRFNMFLMRKEEFFAYSEWLFPLLFAVEAQLDVSGYSAQERRVFGYLAERLLDVWLAVRRPRCAECPVVFLESQHWPRKIAAFLRRKLGRT